MFTYSKKPDIPQYEVIVYRMTIITGETKKSTISDPITFIFPESVKVVMDFL